MLYKTLYIWYAGKAGKIRGYKGIEEFAAIFKGGKFKFTDQTGMRHVQPIKGNHFMDWLTLLFN